LVSELAEESERTNNMMNEKESSLRVVVFSCFILRKDIQAMFRVEG